MAKWAGALLATVLAGCNEDPPKLRTQAEIQDIAEDVAEDKMSALRAEIAELRDKLDELEADQKSTSSQTDAVAAQVARNAEIANQNAIRAMTARGACGTEWRQVGGGWLQTNKQCTLADLSK